MVEEIVYLSATGGGTGSYKVIRIYKLCKLSVGLLILISKLLFFENPPPSPGISYPSMLSSVYQIKFYLTEVHQAVRLHVTSTEIGFENFIGKNCAW